MYNVLCLNKISPIGTKRLGENYTFSPEVQSPDGILVRSAAMHDMELEDNLLAIARAGAGVNNIPVQKCTEQGVVVFNTPGANANAVKELVLCALFLASRKVPAAMDWVKTLKGQGDHVSKLVEKGKGQFAGPEVQGKALGVVGLGAIGILVANAARLLGMDVYGYDPFPPWNPPGTCPAGCTAPCPWMRSTRTATTSPCTCPSPPTPRAWWAPRPWGR